MINFEFQMYFEEFDFNDLDFYIIKKKIKNSKSIS
jgi:hypothetical protein